MKKRFKSKKRLNNLKKIIYIVFILIGFFLSYLYFYYKVRTMISSEDYLNYLLKVGFNNQIDRSYIKSSLLNNITLTNTSKAENNNTEDSNTKEVSNSTKPVVYIYNTHDTEGYASSYFNIYNIKPDVKIASYYLQEKLKSIEEEKEILANMGG